jgi:hypothetical protein
MILGVDFYVDVMRELVIALGAALLVANGLVLVRRRQDEQKAEAQKAQRLKAKNAGVRVKETADLPVAPFGRSLLFLLIGAIVMIWGIASLAIQN